MPDDCFCLTFYFAQFSLETLQVSENDPNMVNPFQSSIAFHIETSHLFCSAKINDWFLYETQHWAEMGSVRNNGCKTHTAKNHVNKPVSGKDLQPNLNTVTKVM